MNRQEFLLLTTTAAGAAIFGFLVGDRGGASAPPLSSTSLDAPDSLEPLIEEIRKLAGLMSERARPSPVRETANRTALGETENGVNAPDMVELLERCAALIERMEQRGSASAGQTSPLFLNSPSATSENFLQYLDTDEGLQTFNEEHQLWNFQQVLDRYGRPDEIRANNSTLIWTYKRVRPDGFEDGWNLLFANGFVFKTEIW